MVLYGLAVNHRHGLREMAHVRFVPGSGHDHFLKCLLRIGIQGVLPGLLRLRDEWEQTCQKYEKRTSDIPVFSVHD